MHGYADVWHHLLYRLSPGGADPFFLPIGFSHREHSSPFLFSQLASEHFGPAALFRHPKRPPRDLLRFLRGAGGLEHGVDAAVLAWGSDRYRAPDVPKRNTAGRGARRLSHETIFSLPVPPSTVSNGT